MVKSVVSEEQEPPIDKEVTRPYYLRYRWVMLALAWLLYFAFGVITRSMAPLVTPIIRDLNISYSQMGVILGSWPLTYIIVAVIGGAIIDRWGIRKSLFVGIIIIGLSGVLRYFPNGFATMLLVVALFGLGGPMISIGCPKMISVWFRGKGRGTAVGIYMTGTWIGGIAAYSMTNSVIMPLTGYSWRLTSVVFGLVAFAAALLWWFLAKDVKSVEATGSAGVVKVFSGLISIRNVQLILIMGLLTFAIGHGFNDWLPKILETGGISPAVAGFFASIPLLVAIPTMLIVPRLVVPRLRGRIVALMALATAIAILIIPTTSGVLQLLGLILYGVTLRAIMPLLMLILMDDPAVGPKYMGSAVGMFFSVAEIGGFGGPFVVGVIKDLTGGFLGGAVVLTGLCLALMVMALWLKTSLAPDTGAL